MLIFYVLNTILLFQFVEQDTEENDTGSISTGCLIKAFHHHFHEQHVRWLSFQASKVYIALGFKWKSYVFSSIMAPVKSSHTDKAKQKCVFFGTMRIKRML